jgi:hypothetical protein
VFPYSVDLNVVADYSDQSLMSFEQVTLGDLYCPKETV